MMIAKIRKTLKEYKDNFLWFYYMFGGNAKSMEFLRSYCKELAHAKNPSELENSKTHCIRFLEALRDLEQEEIKNQERLSPTITAPLMDMFIEELQSLNVPSSPRIEAQISNTNQENTIQFNTKIDNTTQNNTIKQNTILDNTIKENNLQIYITALINFIQRKKQEYESQNKKPFGDEDFKHILLEYARDGMNAKEIQVLLLLLHKNPSKLKEEHKEFLSAVLLKSLESTKLLQGDPTRIAIKLSLGVENVSPEEKTNLIKEIQNKTLDRRILGGTYEHLALEVQQQNNIQKNTTTDNIIQDNTIKSNTIKQNTLIDKTISDNKEQKAEIKKIGTKNPKIKAKTNNRSKKNRQNQHDMDM